MQPVPCVDNERAARLEVEGLRLESQFVLSREITETEARSALGRADLFRASLMVGGCEAVLERSARYALERIQFGRPIGAFQAVRHHLARMVIATDGARLAVNEALTRAESDSDESAIAAVAVFAAARSYVEVALTGAQIHAAVGTTTEHVLHHHFLRAKSMQLRCGQRANRLREICDALVARHEGSLW
jgi:alkylation response protein AidB-like acyl-CoA dehydrogenase